MVIRTTENTQTLNPLPRQRVQAADFGSAGETIGRAAQQAGNAMADYAAAQERIAIQYDEAAAKKADVASLQTIAEIKGRYLSLEGFDAVGARQKAEQDIEKVRREQIGALANERQRAMFGDVFQRRVANDFADIAGHEARQVAAANKEATKARATSYFERAVNDFRNPEAFTAARDTALSEIANLYRGAGEDVIRQKQDEVRSAMHMQIAETLMTDPDDILTAKDWVDQHAEEILAGDETKIRQKLQPGLDEVEIDAAMGMVEEFIATGKFTIGEEEVEGEAATLPAERDGKDDPRAARAERAISAADPLRGRGRVSNTAAQHIARGSDNGLDIAAPAGTAIYPPMSGEVVKKWSDGQNGHAVMIKHSNGYVTGYAHMRSPSPLKVGDEVTSGTVIGAVGSTGKSSGPHLHYTVRRSKDGPKVDPQSVKWEEGDLPEFRPERNDKAELYAAAHDVATRLNLSRRQYDALLQRVDRTVAREDNLRARAQEDLSNSVWEKIVNLGDNFTSLTQLGGSFAELSPQDKQAVLTRIEQNTRPQEPEAYGNTYLDLLEASADPSQQDTFANIDLRRVNGITKGERASLIRAQGSIRGREGKADTQTAASHGRIYTMIDRYAPQADYETGKKATDEDRRRRAKLFERVRDQVNARQEAKGQQLTDDELDGIVRANVIATTVTTPGRLWGEREQQLPAYLSDEVENAASKKIAIPVAERQKIIEAFQRNRGRMPSEREISALYLQGMGR